MTRYIFITGGVMSGVGKGITTASIGLLLKSRGWRVTAVKIDPYINVDAGTMNPTEHGEVFVTTDGDETDQDIGNYERFLDENITSLNYLTTGRVYLSVIERERAMGYGGRNVEVVPDVPAEVIARIERAGKKSRADFVLIEIGGTVGEYQNILFLEAARMMKLQRGARVVTLLVSYLPIPHNLGEMKTKPTQYAVRSLNAAGIQPDMVVCRASETIDDPRKRKIASNCSIAPEDVIAAPDVAQVYEVPLVLESQHVVDRLLHKFGLAPRRAHLKKWRALTRTIAHTRREVHVAVVGKYFSTGKFVLSDAYISVIEALKHAAWAHHARPVLHWINSEHYETHPSACKELKKFDGVVVPGGFGTRGFAGNLAAIAYVRKHNIPYFGLCYGLQMAVIEFARHVCGMRDAHTTEVNPHTSHPLVHILPEQLRNVAEKKYGGTMRLGSYVCAVAPGTHAAAAYKQKIISERHRHRYEVNNAYRERLQKAGLIISGLNPQRDLVEIIELSRRVHPWFVATQFHPELQSRPLAPHPLFKDFIGACLKAKHI